MSGSGYSVAMERRHVMNAKTEELWDFLKHINPTLLSVYSIGDA